MRWLSSSLVAVAAFGLAGCTKTSMQGYADRDLPTNTLQHIAAYVAAPLPLATSMQASIGDEALKHGVSSEDALIILPPTRTYSDAEVRRALAERGVDGVLLITVADSGVVSQYAGTIFQSSYSGTVTANGTVTQVGNMSTVNLNGTVNGTTTGAATPLYRYSRKTQFTARLLDPKSGRTLWVGTGEVDTQGGTGLISRLMVSDSVSSSNSIRAVFDDLQKKGLVGGSS
jgi:hypothetical protein